VSPSEKTLKFRKGRTFLVFIMVSLFKLARSKMNISTYDINKIVVKDLLIGQIKLCIHELTTILINNGHVGLCMEIYTSYYSPELDEFYIRCQQKIISDERDKHLKKIDKIKKKLIRRQIKAYQLIQIQNKFRVIDWTYKEGGMPVLSMREKRHLLKSNDDDETKSWNPFVGSDFQLYKGILYEIVI